MENKNKNLGMSIDSEKIQLTEQGLRERKRKEGRKVKKIEEMKGVVEGKGREDGLRE